MKSAIAFLVQLLPTSRLRRTQERITMQSNLDRVLEVIQGQGVVDFKSWIAVILKMLSARDMKTVRLRST